MGETKGGKQLHELIEATAKVFVSTRENLWPRLEGNSGDGKKLAKMAHRVQECKSCGGRGKNLVRFRGERCAHCVRKENREKLKPIDLISKQLDMGFEDISETGDFQLMKRIVRAAAPGSKGPSVGCPTRIHIVGRLWDDEIHAWNNIFETTRDMVNGKHIGGTDDPYELMLGRFSEDSLEDDHQREMMDPMYVAMGRCAAWDPAILTMRKGEVAEFVCAPEIAYGSHGYPPKVLPNQHVLFEFEVLDWDRALPPVPSRQELERSRLEREAEERARAEANPPPSVDERLQQAEEDRAAGNELFKKSNWAEAKKSYDRAFVSIYFSKEEFLYALKEDEQERVSACKQVLHLNRALCKLKLDMLDEALWDCNQALEIDAENPKALFRRAQVYCAQLRREFGKEDRREFWVLEQAWDMIKSAREDYKVLHSFVQDEHGRDKNLSLDSQQKRALAALRKDMVSLEEKLRLYTRKYREEEKNLFHNKIFKPMDEANARAREEEQKASISESAQRAALDLEDMPDLED